MWRIPAPLHGDLLTSSATACTIEVIVQSAQLQRRPERPSQLVGCIVFFSKLSQVMRARVAKELVAVQRSIARFIVGKVVLPRAPRFPKCWEAGVDEGFMEFPRDGVDDV